jgi:hypothetical protein
MRYTHLGVGHSVTLRRIARDAFGTDSPTWTGTEAMDVVDEEDLDGGEGFQEGDYQQEDCSDEDDDSECDDEEDVDSDGMDGKEHDGDDEDEELEFSF